MSLLELFEYIVRGNDDAGDRAAAQHTDDGDL